MIKKQTTISNGKNEQVTDDDVWSIFMHGAAFQQCTNKRITTVNTSLALRQQQQSRLHLITQ